MQKSFVFIIFILIQSFSYSHELSPQASTEYPREIIQHIASSNVGVTHVNLGKLRLVSKPFQSAIDEKDFLESCREKFKKSYTFDNDENVDQGYINVALKIAPNNWFDTLLGNRTRTITSKSITNFLFRKNFPAHLFSKDDGEKIIEHYQNNYHPFIPNPLFDYRCTVLDVVKWPNGLFLAVVNVHPKQNRLMYCGESDFSIDTRPFWLNIGLRCKITLQIDHTGKPGILLSGYENKPYENYISRVTCPNTIINGASFSYDKSFADKGFLFLKYDSMRLLPDNSIETTANGKTTIYDKDGQNIISSSDH